MKSIENVPSKFYLAMLFRKFSCEQREQKIVKIGKKKYSRVVD